MKTNINNKGRNVATYFGAITWENRYRVKKHFPFGFIIEFEETTVLGWYAFEKDAYAVCGQLNGAFNLGKESAYLELSK